jgi:hypothetical protein
VAKYAGHLVSGKKKKSVVGESPPIADADADADADAPPPRDHIMAQKNDEEVRGREVVVTPAVLLTRIVVV